MLMQRHGGHLGRHLGLHSYSNIGKAVHL